MKRERPPAVVLDINMPRLGGLEALKRIRAFAPTTRVVVCSGMLEPTLERQAIGAGAVAAFGKPVVLEALRIALEGGTPLAASRQSTLAVVGDARRPARVTVARAHPAVDETLR